MCLVAKSSMSKSTLTTVTQTQTQSMAVVLAWAFAALIAYASLYPFVGWSGAGLNLAEIITSPWPTYWTWFDVSTNAVGYAPLGFLIVVAARRTRSRTSALLLSLLLCSCLSLALEWGQSYLPRRIPSNVDWALNSLGGLVGSAVAALAVQAEWIARWDRWRRTWLASGAKLDIVLLALWPVAALYPSSVPFGLGHVRVRFGLVNVDDWQAPAWLFEPMAAIHAWSSADLVAMTGLQESLVMGMSVLAPSLLACAAGRGAHVRLWGLFTVWLTAATVGIVSAALTYGPGHALDWWRPNMWLALMLVLGVSWFARRLARVVLMRLVVVVLIITLWLLNTSGSSAYLDQSLQIWEAGQFIRFHGASQWLGWLWPFAVLSYASMRMFRKT